jgi:protein O-GlcNAc transferase
MNYPDQVMDRALNLAVQYQRAGHIDEAKQLYIRILEREPDRIEALYNLSVLASEVGDFELAAGLARRAIALNPARPLLHFGLGVALDGAGRQNGAVSEWRTAIGLDPNCVDALFSLGNALRIGGSLREAIVCFERVVALRPADIDKLNNLGEAYLAAGRIEEAAACLKRVVAERPDGHMGLNNLASLLRTQGDLAGAEACLRKAIGYQPNNAYLRTNLAHALVKANRIGEAIAILEEAIRVIPAVAELHITLGSTYLLQGRFEKSLQSYRQALSLHSKLSRYHGIILFALHYSPELDPYTLAHEHRIWATRHADSLLPPDKGHANAPDPERKIRVGYVSGDLSAHPVGFFMDPILAAHNRDEIDVVCYAGGKVDTWTERMRESASLWRGTIGLGDAELAQRIEQDQIDILVDLSGHSEGNRLLAIARKPAPVQVSWLGYFNTTGMRAIDYLIVDSNLAPLEEKAPFVEEPLRIPSCYLAYRVPKYAPPVSPAPCIERGFITYGTFNALSKIGTHVVPVWAEILGRNPTARLVMKNGAFADEASRSLYRHHFEQCGISPERVDLLGPSPHEELLPFYSQIDIALDPFPYNGGTTTCESLAMGVPVVTLRGDRFVSRVGSTILYNVGLGELVAHTQAEYIDKAIELGQNPALLAEMRANMRTRLAESTLCDTAGFTKKLEQAYREIWRRWCAAAQSQITE